MQICPATSMISEILKFEQGYPWAVPPMVPQILPRKYFSHFDQIPNHRREGTCVSCYHFQAEVALDEDMDVDIMTRVRLPRDEAAYRSGPPLVWGYCLYFHPLIVGKLSCNDTCPYHDRKPDPLQFEDDAMTDFNEEPGVAPFTGTVLPG